MYYAYVMIAIAHLETLAQQGAIRTAPSRGGIQVQNHDSILFSA